MTTERIHADGVPKAKRRRHRASAEERDTEEHRAKLERKRELLLQSCGRPSHPDPQPDPQPDQTEDHR